MLPSSSDLEHKQKELDMPLNSKGKKIMSAMMKEYGAKKGKTVFYASENKGTIKGIKAKEHRATKTTLKG